ncbi:MAG: glycosyltransferase family 39 protein [Endomicrobiia bacterium]|nr:glycosyltransferase family 39 protein [Endomicrobiia bacterium]
MNASSSPSVTSGAVGRAASRRLRARSLRLAAVVFAAALIIRLWGLDKVPTGFYLDEGVYALCASDILDGISRPAYFNRLWGVDAMYAYIAAVSFKIFGASIVSLRIVSALAGAVTVAGIFLLAFEIFRRKKYSGGDADDDLFAYRAALVAAFAMAFSRWHITFSRIAFQGILLPLVSSFAFYFLYRAFANRKTRDFAVSGVLLGAAFYTYLPSRFVPFAALFAVVCEALRMRYSREDKKLPALARGVAIMVVAAVLVSLPLWLHFVRHPEFFLARSRAVFDGASPSANFIKSALMFGFEGDSNPRHNIPVAPMFSFGLFVLFAGGVALGAKNLVFGPRRSAAAFLFFWFAAMFLPSIFSSEAPHALRTIGVLPPAFILCGYFAASAYGALGRGTILKALTAAALLAAMAFVETKNYFFVWAPSEETRRAFGAWQVDVLRRAGGLLDSHEVFLPMSFYVNPAMTFLARAEFGSKFRCVSALPDFEFESKPPRDFIYVASRLSLSEIAVEESLKKIYPEARVYATETAMDSSPIFVYYLVPASAARAKVALKIRNSVAAAIEAVRAQCEAAPWLRDQLKYCDPIRASGSAARGGERP